MASFVAIFLPSARKGRGGEGETPRGGGGEKLRATNKKKERDGRVAREGVKGRRKGKGRKG